MGVFKCGICGATNPTEHKLTCRFHSSFVDDVQQPSKRTFDTGATRDTEDGKLDYEGFLSPLVLRRYAEYLDANRAMADGSLRDSDNWQQGIPSDVYMKSAWRHFMDVWAWHRSSIKVSDIEAALCAVLFNIMGYLHEVLKPRH